MTVNKDSYENVHINTFYAAMNHCLRDARTSYGKPKAKTSHVQRSEGATAFRFPASAQLARCSDSMRRLAQTHCWPRAGEVKFGTTTTTTTHNSKLLHAHRLQ
eukprot:5590808-Amphidinium_carterae.1